MDQHISTLMSEIKTLLATYQSLNLSAVLDHEKFNHFAITHHSTWIEGSTLTLPETILLLNEQLTPKGKPLVHSLMVQNHYEALIFTLEAARAKRTIDMELIRAINARVLRQTGALYRTVFGDLDSSQGVFRKANVSAGTRYFPHYEKVESLCRQFVAKIEEALPAAHTLEEQLHLASLAHFDLVSIHPFYDGNGRTSRLLMNYLQAYFGLPLGIIFSEDKSDYFEALEATRTAENFNIFYRFMLEQYKKFLLQEIHTYQRDIG